MIIIDSLSYFLKSIGLGKIKSIQSYEYNHSDYSNIKKLDNEKLILHKEFLKTLIDEERLRLDNLETKTAQLISQTSLVISIISLFIPILLEKSNELNDITKISLLLLLILTYLFYVLTIINALKNYNVKKFNYSNPSPENVLLFKDKSIKKFNKEIIKDYLYSINVNQNINNTKATNILHSYNSFKIANILLSVLVISVCISHLKQSNNSKNNQNINEVNIDFKYLFDNKNKIDKETNIKNKQDTINKSK